MKLRTENITFNPVSGISAYLGYAQDRTDGTFLISADANSTHSYLDGLAIDGTSREILWRGSPLATLAQISEFSSTISAEIASVRNAIDQTDATKTNMEIYQFVPEDIPTLRSYYAHWRITIGDLKIIGGRTNDSEGTKTINFTPYTATSASIFTTCVLSFLSGGNRSSGSTANGWQYTTINSLTTGKLVQIGNGSYWIAIGI